MKALRCVSPPAAVILAVATLTAASAGHGVVGTAPAFHLVFDGRHNQNLLHEGPFTTAASFCPSGYATDVSVDELTLTALRRFSCDVGGTFTARVGSLRAEHGGNGTWQIVGGDGPLADLRGQGTFASVLVSGSLDDPASITFRNTWDGVADFDVAPPAITFSRATARKLETPKGAYQLRIAISLEDSAGGESYSLFALDPRKPFSPLGSKSGRTSTGKVSVVLRVRPAKRTRVLRLTIDASDPFGNRASLAKRLRLP